MTKIKILGVQFIDLPQYTQHSDAFEDAIFDNNFSFENLPSTDIILDIDLKDAKSGDLLYMHIPSINAQCKGAKAPSSKAAYLVGKIF